MTDYYAIECRVRCYACGMSVPLAGLGLHHECPSCGAIADPEPWFFGSLFWHLKQEIQDEDLSQRLSTEDGYRGSFDTSGGYNYRYRFRREHPKCPDCGRDLPTAGVAAGETRSVRCSECGHEVPTYPTPDWAKAEFVLAEQIFGGTDPALTNPPPQGSDARPTDSDPAKSAVAIRCPQCGGDSRLTAADRRTQACTFCQSQVFIPEDVWRKLRPRPRLPVWYVRLDHLPPEEEARRQEQLRQQKNEKRDVEWAEASAMCEGFSQYATITHSVNCSRCGLPIPVNGPMLDLFCNYCGHTQHQTPYRASLIFEELWNRLEDIPPGYRRPFRLTNDPGLGCRYQYQYWRGQPTCPSCNDKLPVDHIADGAVTTLSCPGCGHTLPTYPPPAWMVEQGSFVTQIFGGLPPAPTDRADAALPLEADPQAPTVMACPACRGALSLQDANERLSDCPHCGTRVFLPDALWRALHPLRTVAPWSIRLADMQPSEVSERWREVKYTNTVRDDLDDLGDRFMPPASNEVRDLVVELSVTCDQCDGQVPIDGLVNRVTCNLCDHTFPVPPVELGAILRLIEGSMEYLNQEGAESRSGKIDYAASNQYDYRFAFSAPRCEQCDEPLDLQGFTIGTTTPIRCQACGHAMVTYVAPDWLQSQLPAARQIIGGVDPKPADVDPVEPSAEAGAADKPKEALVLPCPECGASLPVDNDTARHTACDYCGAEVLIPNVLWFRLHPIPIRRQWYIRLVGPLESELSAWQQRQDKVRFEKELRRQMLNHIVLFTGIGLLFVAIMALMLYLQFCR